jgi:stearoyl-CoA desaturase (delta-9 desaturase)
VVENSPSESNKQTGKQTGKQSLAQKLNWTNLLFLTITPALALILVPIYFMSHPLTWGLVAFFVISYTLTNMSITTGYHRYFAHRSFESRGILRFLFVMVGSAAFQGSVLQWSTDHRRHHRAVDSDQDPYSINKGFWYAHIGWMLFKELPEYRGKYAVDLQKSRLLVLQDRYYVFFASFMGFIVPALVGWALGFGFFGGMIIGGLLRVVLTQHSTFFINSLCHMVGRQPYSDRHSARDSLIMAVLTFGEGYHNYHHQFQADYRNGIRWYHWDPTKWSIRFFALCGLASRLKQVSASEILRVRLQMDTHKALVHGACADRLQIMRKKVDDSQERLKMLRTEYHQKYIQMKVQMTDQLNSPIKVEMRIAKLEFKAAYRQWLIYTRSFQT